MSNKRRELTELAHAKLVGMIGDGVSWRSLEKEFNIPQSTIRKWATEQGVGRDRTSAKRKMVDDILLQDKNTNSMHSIISVHGCAESITTGNPLIDAAAGRDASVMRLASNTTIDIIRGVLKRVNAGDLDCKELAAAAMANDKAISTYMRINKLDDAPKGEIEIVWQGV